VSADLTDGFGIDGGVAAVFALRVARVEVEYRGDRIPATCGGLANFDRLLGRDPAACRRFWPQ